jgi:tRNA1(Val) A37 N6-methylase TrmN6
MSVASQDYLLDRRVRYAQPIGQYRSGIEPVLLAAAIPARAGQRVLELGTGAGAGVLCLATRVPGIGGVGVEIQPELAELARQNLTSNGFNAAFRIIEADAVSLALPDRFDHAFSNPPWHSEAGTASPIEGRDRARRSRKTLLGAWTDMTAKHLLPRGTLTLILPASALQQGLLALAASGFGAISLLPLWPKLGREAKVMLLQGVKGSFGPCHVLPGLTLHQPDGHYTPEANAILRDGNALAFSPLNGQAASIV